MKFAGVIWTRDKCVSKLVILNYICEAATTTKRRKERGTVCVCVCSTRKRNNVDTHQINRIVTSYLIEMRCVGQH